jgi:hypothetical protein
MKENVKKKLIINKMEEEKHPIRFQTYNNKNQSIYNKFKYYGILCLYNFKPIKIG